MWSLMTIFCGLATTYWQLALSRAGVSIGEAGSNPTAHSLIADLFPPEKRARAVAFYASGGPLGTFIGASLVGLLAVQLGWRAAFYVLGAAGILLALVIAVLIPRHIPRGTYDIVSDDATPTLRVTLRTLAADRCLRQLVSAASLAILVIYVYMSFLASFLVRAHDLSIAHAGVLSGLINGIAAIAGTMLGGFLADRLGSRDVR